MLFCQFLAYNILLLYVTHICTECVLRYTSNRPTALKFRYFYRGMGSNKQALIVLHLCKFTATQVLKQ